MSWRLALLGVLVGAGLARAGELEEIRARFAALRPAESQLAMYRLRWESSLERALARGREERRAVAVVIIHARYGDIATGHC